MQNDVSSDLFVQTTGAFLEIIFRLFGEKSFLQWDGRLARHSA